MIAFQSIVCCRFTKLPAEGGVNNKKEMVECCIMRLGVTTTTFSRTVACPENWRGWGVGGGGGA